MLSFASRYSLRAQFLALGMTIVVLASIGGLFGGFSMWSMDAQFRSFANAADHATRAAEIDADVNRALLSAREYLAAPSPEGLGDVRGYVAGVREEIAAAQQDFADPDSIALLDNIDEAFDGVASGIDRLVALLDERDRLVDDVLDPLGSQLRTQLTDVTEESTRADDWQTAALAGTMQEDLMLARLYASKLLLSNAEEHAERVEAKLGELAETVSRLAARLRVTNSPAAAGFSDFGPMLAEYRGGFDALRALVNESTALRTAALDEGGAAITAWASDIKTSAAQTERQLGEQALETIDSSEVAIVVAIVLASLIAAALSVLGARSMTREIRGVVDEMHKLAGGDTDVRTDASERGDEIGEMGKALIAFRDAAIDKQRLERETAEQRALAEIERKRLADEQALVVDATSDAMTDLSLGDLTTRIDADVAESYRKLKDDFNIAVEKLQQTIGSVRSATDGIKSGAGEIAQATDDLSRRTESQAASLEETASAVEQITATVRRTADGATHARDVVSGARAEAEKSGDVVRKAIEAMSAIERSSKQINQIIGVIDEIAFQTNLLALNAGVEAARAGDAGRGFAVVASEVRALAQRSADAAKQIKDLISTSAGQVDQGVALVGQTGTALERIVVSVTEINKVVSEIASGAQEQATGLQQVSTAVNQMDQVTQQNAAMVEEATAATRSLAQQTDELAHLVGRFQVGQGDRARAPGKVVPLASAQQTAWTDTGSAAQSARPVQKAVAAGGGGRRAAPSTDGWEEF
jgi:methyl-accepting chemotaxis protein